MAWILFAAIELYWWLVLAVAWLVLGILFVLASPFVDPPLHTPAKPTFRNTHPLGHAVYPLEQLTKSERELWDEVRRGVA